MKKNKGITMISLVITIIVLLIVTSITIGNGLGQLGIKRVNNLYADIETISTKVAEYYLKNETLPVYDNLYVNNKQELEELFKKNGATENITNVNDGDEYYVINPTKLDNLTLNYGDDYKEWTNTSTSEEIQNIYIINSVTHQIYFPHGVKSGDEYFFARFPDEDEVTAVELGEIEDEWNMILDDATKDNLNDNKISFIANITLEGVIDSYNLNTLEYAWDETDNEQEATNLSYTKFSYNSIDEENNQLNASLSSKEITTTADHYNLWVRVMDVNGKYAYKKKSLKLSPEIVPVLFQKVEYIESTGTQYIDTEVYPSSKLNIELDIALKSSEGDQKFFGSYGNGGICLGTLNNKWRYGSNFWQMNNGTATTDRILIIVEGNTFTFGNDKYTANSISDNTEHSMLLSAIAYRGSLYSKSKMTIFKTKISSEQNIIRDFIPCYRKSDNVKGLYDIVEGKFYTNQVTGDDFIAGENVY